MEVYNAANEQKCAICNFTISHNKQGRFTSPLLMETFGMVIPSFTKI